MEDSRRGAEKFLKSAPRPYRMDQPFRRFVSTLAAVWMGLAAGGFTYAHFLNLPFPLAAPLVAAFLWEASFYLAPGFAAVREAATQRWQPPLLAAGLTASALAPYLAYALPSGLFQWKAALALVLLTGAASFWFVIAPPGRAADFGFVAFMAAVILSRIFQDLYPSPAYNVPLSILGQLMWIRLGVWSILCLRRVEGTGFGFWPSRSDWRCGLLHYLLFLPAGALLGIGIGAVRFRPVEMEWWQVLLYAVGTFAGMLWVVALSEEFFFRGLLQPWFSRWLGNKTAGLLLASALFGLVHLPFRGFPNWRFAIVAAIAGVFYGRAFDQSRGIRAPMVAHALVNTTMRLFFS